MKRVMILLPQLGTGGIQKMNIELAAHIHDPRVELVVVSLYPNSGSVIDQQAKKQGVRVVYLDKKPGVDLSMIGKLYRFMKEYKPDVIHINQRMTSYALIPMLLQRVKKRIYVVHSMADRDARGIARKINRFAFHHLKLIPIAISQTCRTSISEVYNIPETRIPIIYNGVDLARFKRTAPFPSLTDECVFINVCIFRDEKNLPLLLDAFAKVHTEIPNTRLILVGEGKILYQLKTIIIKHGIEDCVELPGSVDNVSEWLNKAHVYVLSSNVEGLPVSVLEAMSMALPIVATKAGGVVDIVKDGSNGFLTEIGDTEQLADAMLKLAKDPALRAKLSVASERLSQNYGIEKCVESYIKMYTSV